RRLIHHHRSFGRKRLAANLDERSHSSAGRSAKAYGLRDRQRRPSRQRVLHRGDACQPRRQMGHERGTTAMTNSAWSLTEFTARALDPAERDAVLGDLTEAGETGWNALKNVLGLVFLRQTLQLKTAKPWLAGLGIALPTGYLLMGVSAS